MAKEMGDAIVEYEDLYKKLLKYQIDFTSSVPDRLGSLTLAKYLACIRGIDLFFHEDVLS